MIVVTGAAGFIGSNLVHALNALGRHDILAVDDLTDGTKFKNLGTAKLYDYLDKDDFLVQLDKLGKIDVIFHQGACSATTEWNGKLVMGLNYDYSKALFHHAKSTKTPLIYASSASVYGMGSEGFSEAEVCENPLNMYAYSKFLFDQYVRREALKKSSKKSQVVGLRYFNVYGPREQHKGGMASVAFHQHHQCLKDGEVRLFEGSDGYENGEQRRDFIHVDDVVALNLWFWQHPEISGIFNAGTGRAQPFNDVAKAVLAWHGFDESRLRYIPFPEHLKGRYQAFTEADLSHLRAVGCDHAFMDVATGVQRYLNVLAAS